MKRMMKFYLCLHKFVWTLKFIFSSSHGKLFLVLSQAFGHIFSFYKMQKGL